MWQHSFRKLPNAASLYNGFSKLNDKLYRAIQRNLSVGDSVQVTRVFTEKDVLSFAEITGDLNPIHINSEVAQKTKFGKCIVHGAFLNGLISAVLGMNLPGAGSVLIYQYLEFCAPLFVGEEVKANVEIATVKRNMVECTYFCEATARKEIVMKGYAKLLVMALEHSPLSKCDDNQPSSKEPS